MSTAKEAPPWEKIEWNTRNPTLEIDDGAFREENEWIFNTPIALSEIKDRIALLNEDVWEYYKKLTNPYELIFTTNGLIPTPSSTCLMHPLSRSYFKMIEMIQVSNMLKRFPLQTLKTAHVCEGPGGFIQAAYDEADRCRKRIIHTYAMTLRPTENQVPGWKRAMNFLKKHPEIKILYGKNGTGNILEKENRQSFYEECKSQIHIFTADGGIDFADNYKEQEKTIYPLLIASSLMALHCLAENGVFVLKIFDCFTRATEDLIYGLGSCFGSWTLYKPATSRPCNSEQYFIGVGFRRLNAAVIIRAFERILENPFLPTHIWKMQEGQLDVFRAKQLERSRIQIEYIQNTLELIEKNNSKEHAEIWNKHICESQKFCTHFHLPVVHSIQKAEQMESSIRSALSGIAVAAVAAATAAAAT
jgi:23S rRNA U2552 (ribose-2'-O)-methylase RlmE/FtsJ